MKKHFILLIASISLADSINYETLNEDKKISMKQIEKLKNSQIDAINYELSDFETINTKNSGENIVDSVENQMYSKNVNLVTYVMGNKNEYKLNSKVSFENEFLIEGNPLNLGMSLLYTNMKNDKNYLNGVQSGIKLKANLADYNIQFLSENRFNYFNIDYNKIFNQHYFGLLGSFNLNTTIGSSFYVKPALRTSYNYNFKSVYLDQNKDKITLMPGVNLSIGGQVSLGYKNDKVDVSLSYGLNKRLKNSNKYKMYNKDLETKENNYISHDFSANLKYKINDNHKLIASVGYVNKNVKGGLAYNYSW